MQTDRDDQEHEWADTDDFNVKEEDGEFYANPYFIKPEIRDQESSFTSKSSTTVTFTLWALDTGTATEGLHMSPHFLL